MMIGFGGFLGGVCRFQLGRIISRRSNTGLPIGTFVINITGAFLLGILTSLNPAKPVYLFWGDGFLGAYTTFSTFMYEGFNLFHENEKLNAATYIIGSLIIGVLGYVLGYALGKQII